MALIGLKAFVNFTFVVKVLKIGFKIVQEFATVTLIGYLVTQNVFELNLTENFKKNYNNIINCYLRFNKFSKIKYIFKSYGIKLTRLSITVTQTMNH